MFPIKTYYNKGDVFIFLPMTQLLLLRRQLYAWFKCLLLSKLWTLWDSFSSLPMRCVRIAQSP